MCPGEGKQLFNRNNAFLLCDVNGHTPAFGSHKIYIIEDNPWSSLLYILCLYHLYQVAKTIVKEIDQFNTLYPKNISHGVGFRAFKISCLLILQTIFGLV